MFGGFRGISHFMRYRQLRHDLDMKAPMVGSSSTPTSVCTWLMGAGVGVFVIGWLLTLKAFMMVGGTLLVVGLLIAVVSSLLDVLSG